MTRPFVLLGKNGNSVSVAILVLLMAAAFGSLLARPAAADDYSHVRIIRLSFVEGQVHFQRLNEGWQNASQNLPVEEGVQLKTDAGFAEVEFEAGLYLRMAQNSTVAFAELGLQDGKRITKMELLSGTAIVTAKDVGHDQISVVAGNMTLKVDHNGDYRIDLAPQGAWVTVLRGKVDVLAGSREVTLSSKHTLHEADENLDSIEVVQSAALDSFDKWVSQRDQTAEEYTDATTSYVRNGGNYGIGFADLYNYGLWYNCPGFGMCWQPYGVGNGWIPFASGQWQCLDGFGWTWVSAEPWGWLPYHFGGWYNAPGQGWVWVPGSGRMWNNWQPGTATWLNMQNMVAWTPTLAVPTKPSKVSNQESLRQSEVILAAQANGNSIRPMARLPILQTQSASIRTGAAPALNFAAGASASGSVAAAAPVAGGGGGAAQSQVMSARVNRVSEKSLAPAAGAPNSGRFMDGPRGTASNSMRAAQAGAPAKAAPRAAEMRPVMSAEMRAARAEGEFSRGSGGNTSSASRVQGGGGNSSSGLSRASGGGNNGGGLTRASGNGSSGGGGGFSRSSGGGGSAGGGSSSSAGSSHAAPAAPSSSSGGGAGGASSGIKH